MYAISQRKALHLPFHGVPSMKVYEIPTTKGDIQTQGCHFVQPQRLGPLVDEPKCTGDHILLGKDPIQQLYHQMGDRVL